MPNPVLTRLLDDLIVGHGWTLLDALSADWRPAAEGDTYLVLAVPWSAWDGASLRDLAKALVDKPEAAVAVANLDTVEPSVILRVLEGHDRLPYAAPVIVRYLDGRLSRLEQGWPAVEWMRGMASPDSP
jgi:hypothetical protein